MKVLTSATVMARINLCKEWKSAKSLKKKDLITNYVFAKDIQARKLPELKQMAEQYLLEGENELVGMYQKELDQVTVLLPPVITSIFACPPDFGAENKEEVVEADEHSAFEELEKEILDFLDRKIDGDEASKVAEDEALLPSMLSSLS